MGTNRCCAGFVPLFGGFLHPPGPRNSRHQLSFLLAVPHRRSSTRRERAGARCAPPARMSPSLLVSIDAMLSSTRSRRSEGEQQRPTTQFEWLMAAEMEVAEMEAVSQDPGSLGVLKVRNDGNDDTRRNRLLVRVPRKGGRLGIGLNDQNQVLTKLESANGLQVQDRCGVSRPLDIPSRFAPTACSHPCTERSALPPDRR